MKVILFIVCLMFVLVMTGLPQAAAQDPSLEQIKMMERKLQDLEKELSDLSRKYAPQHPQMLATQIEIEKLKKAQMGPVDLLNTIGTTVNSTDAVWLNTMRDDGRSISLDGNALSANAVAKLITNLKATGYFKAVEIRETFQSPGSHDVTLFQFTLVCEKADTKS